MGASAVMLPPQAGPESGPSRLVRLRAAVPRAPHAAVPRAPLAAVPRALRAATRCATRARSLRAIRSQGHMSGHGVGGLPWVAPAEMRLCCRTREPGAARRSVGCAGPGVHIRGLRLGDPGSCHRRGLACARPPAPA